MAAKATFALKAGVWFRRGRLVMVSPVRHAYWPLSGRNSTYPDVQISRASSTTSKGGDNGDSKVDIVQFNQGGLNKIGLAYSADGVTADSWKFASHDTVSTPSG